MANEVERAQAKPQKRQICRFFSTKNGCRAGDACPYLHPEPSASAEPAVINKPRQTKATQASSSNKYQPPGVESSRVVQRPKPQVEDPRAFQIGQVQRRFKPTVSEKDGETVLTFKMAPSDPDFPYDIEALDCTLTVPTSYPEANKPSLRITNKDIPRGFQINIEQGFDVIVANAPDATLLGLFNRLDKQLEKILAGDMAETFKLVVNRGPQRPQETISRPYPPPVPTPAATQLSRPQFTSSQKAEAQLKRKTDTRQLEARFGRLQLFYKAPDGFSYTLPLDSPKRASWPVALRSLRSSTLLLPEHYPLEASAILLDSDSVEARNAEDAFRARSEAGADATLTQQINYFSQHLHEMAVLVPDNIAPTAQPPVVLHSEVKDSSKAEESAPTDADRPHVHVIPRPPEWSVGATVDENESDFSDSDDYSYDSGDDTEGSAMHTDGETRVSAPVEKGILMSFPGLELHGIELMELTSLNLTIKCERCKDTSDIERIRNNVNGDPSGMRDQSCKKCANNLAVGFRADLIHANSVRAGYLDLDGCTVIDMLPSHFTPTCSECSTPHPAPGVVSVRGDSTMAICRECHKKLTFRIPEVKFLQVSAAAIRASKAPGRKKAKENLGISVGSELPRRGRCAHYGKSYRWFRCHDELSDHPNEHANRMICGHCSREQPYSPELCKICHSPLTGRKGTGFWEGGKGTRDKSRMSRKDPRKYKRRPGGAAREGKK